LPADHPNPKVFKVEPVEVDYKPQAYDPRDFSPALLIGSNAQANFLAESLAEAGIELARLGFRYDFSNSLESRFKSLILVWPGQDKDPSLAAQALLALQSAGPGLKALVGVTSLGGSFSYPRGGERPEQLGNYASAALAGLIKCAAREWPLVLSRVIDLPLAAHEMLLPEIQDKVREHIFAPGPVEIGIPGTGATLRPALVPWTLDPLTLDPLTLDPLSSRKTAGASQGAEHLPLSPGDTLVVTGGGRGVTAALLKEIARLYQPRIVILGRTPLGPPEPPWLKTLSTEREINQALHRASDGKLKPLELKARAQLTLRSRELKETLSALKELGAVEYIPGDFSNGETFDAALRTIRRRYGPIKGLFHGAGIIADKTILEKDRDEFRRVFDTKVGLAIRLLEAFQEEPLKLIIFMSSSTARFGRAGQADYAAANEVLNKIAWEEAANRPEALVLSLLWGPFDGGMVDPALAKKFASEKIGLISLPSGAKALSKILSHKPGTPSELLLLGDGTDLQQFAGEFKSLYPPCSLKTPHLSKGNP
jgi:NAD(P)-dependent dehydrogenase (short-subunit alcohol dehydrogenase family)